MKRYNLLLVILLGAFIWACAPTTGGNNDESSRTYNVSMDNNTGTIYNQMTVEKEDPVSSSSTGQTGADISPDTRFALSMPTGGSTSALATEKAVTSLENVSSMLKQVQQKAAEALQNLKDANQQVEEEAAEIEEVEPVIDINTLGYETRYDHTTWKSSDGGKSLVLCEGDDRDDMKCFVYDKSNDYEKVDIPYHGLDNNRISYWLMHLKETDPEPEGDIICKDGEKYLRFKSENSIDRGSCD